MGLTRQERAEQYYVGYGNHLVAKATPSPKASPKPSPKPTPKPTAVKSKPAAAKPVATKKPSVTPVKRTMGPASKTGRPSVPLPKRPLVVPDPKKEEQPLPQGWRIRNRSVGGQTFISPDGKEFLERSAALAYSVSVASSPARYLHDNSLPQGWRVQSIQGRIYYFSPRGERFESREAVAQRLAEDGQSSEVVEKVRAGHKRKAGPKSVMLQRGEAGYQKTEEWSG